MNVWLMVGVSAALLLLFNFSRVTFSVRFRESFSLRVGYLFFHYTVFPRPPKKGEQRAAGPEKPSGFRKKIRGLLERRGLSGFLSVLKSGASAASGTAKRFFAHLGIDRFLLAITVGGENAAQTAVEYGAVCASVSAAAGVLLSQGTCRTWSVTVDPDFSDHSSVRFEMKAGIRLIFLLLAVLYGLERFAEVAKGLKGKAGA